MRWILLVTSLVVAATSCEEATGPVTDATGSLSFSHNAGQFAASGAYSSKSSDNTKRTTTWAVGFQHVPTNTTIVEAHFARTDGRSDQILIIFDRRATGNSDVSSSCTDNVSHICPSIEVLFGTTGDFFSDPNATSCVVTSGTATLTTLSDERATGSFSGTGTCKGPAGDTVLNIQNGTFDVGLVTEP